jgi:hypothetical protein
MRTRRLCGLTLVVLAWHALAWQIAFGSLPRFAPARAGTRLVAIVSVPQGVRVPSKRTEVAGADVHAATGAPSPRATGSPVRGRPRAPVTAPARAPTGYAGDPRQAAADAAEWPVYATRAPPSATLRYALVQGGSSAASGPAATAGTAQLEWTREATTFSLRVTLAQADRPPREWQSTGTFDAAGVAPLRLVERASGRDKRAINFDRAAGRVRFSGATGAPAIAAGVQDRWSWIAQLAAIAEADAQRGPIATHWDLQVAGLRGELEQWTFRVLPAGDLPVELVREGNEPSTSGDRAPALLHVVRAAERPYDLRIEAWLSPSLHHLPAGLRMSTPPGAWSLSLWRRAS